MLGKNQWTLRNLLLFFGVLYLSLATETCNAQDKPTDVKALLKERRDLLSKAVDEMMETYLLPRANASYPLQQVIQAERDSLRADLDWFDKPKGRIQAIEKHKKTADRLLAIATANVKIARQPIYVVPQAKAYVLEVQIELLKEKEKQKAKPGK
jgi:hypothetical protein